MQTAKHDMKKQFKKYGVHVLVLFVVTSFYNCTGTKTSYQKEYNKIWREMVKSEAWQESIEKQAQEEELYASADNEMIVLEESRIKKNKILFDKEYQALVSRAYFKIITEAEKADARITSEYRILQKREEQNPAGVDKNFKRKKEAISKKYHAHKAMLDGLKSWNIFSENRSGDLDYFKMEYRSEVEKMISNGDEKNQIVNFLIYKMADLYHLDE
jgi:hypothetical protein